MMMMMMMIVLCVGVCLFCALPRGWECGGSITVFKADHRRLAFATCQTSIHILHFRVVDVLPPTHSKGTCSLLSLWSSPFAIIVRNYAKRPNKQSVYNASQNGDLRSSLVAKGFSNCCSAVTEFEKCVCVIYLRNILMQSFAKRIDGPFVVFENNIDSNK